MKASSIDNQWVRTAVGVVTVLIALTGWELIGRSGSVPFLVPCTSAVSGAWGLLTGPALLADIVPSALRALSGFLIGSALGVLFGVPLGHVRGLDAWFRPTLEFLRATPLPALLPIAFVAFGANDGTRIGLIAIAALWPVLLNSTDGAGAVDRNLIDAARTAGVKPLRVLLTVVLPGTLPQIFAGLRVGLGIALVMMVVSELVSSLDGLGFLVLQAQRSFALVQMYSGVLLLGILGGLFTLAFNLCERRVLRWYAGQKGLLNA